MDYKSIEYSVDETANPAGWKWTVRLGTGNIRTGSTYSRQIGLRLAEVVIEKALALRPTALTEAIDLRQHYAELKSLREQVRKFEGSLFVVRKRRREGWRRRAPGCYSAPKKIASY